MKNLAYIDGQNLFKGTTLREPVWEIDLARFRVYLDKKYNIDQAYYFLGYVQEGEKAQELYEEIQNAGFVVVFRQHNSAMIGKKKGNVDSDIIFSIMKKLCRNEDFEKIVLVSGDGDYKMMVDFLIEEDKLKKILFPKRNHSSSLYKKLGAEYLADLSDKDVRKKIGKEKRAP